MKSKQRTTLKQVKGRQIPTVALFPSVEKYLTINKHNNLQSKLAIFKNCSGTNNVSG